MGCNITIEEHSTDSEFVTMAIICIRGMLEEMAYLQKVNIPKRQLAKMSTKT
jgi:hypothetical protein